MDVNPAAWAAQQSRELALLCDQAGNIAAADDRAVRLLDAAVGQAFVSLAVPGTEQKAQALVERGRVEALDGWEVSLVARGVPATVLFAAQPAPDGGVHLHGLVMPDGYGETVRQLSEALDEVLELNREISRQKKALAAQHDQLAGAYRELDESNKGMLTLHAEIADRADVMRRTAEVKGRVVANVSHEFKTPVNSILGLSQLLMDQVDGPLTDEQRKQVGFIRTSAQELLQIVNDLLDLAKTEAGKMQIRPQRFTLRDFFAALRGTLRPLIPASHPVAVHIDAPPEEITLETDQGKIAQILRNLVSNALKFTERGEIRVVAGRRGESVVFTVSDSGIGIAPPHYETIFEEFGQIDSEVQQRVRGTGLGLPLSRTIAESLGGTLTVTSELGVGSTFTLTVPAVHAEVVEIERMQQRPLEPEKAPILVVEDDRKTIFVYEKYLSMAGFQVLPARTVEEARTLLAQHRPSAIVLDIMLEGESTWEFLAEVKRDAETADIPVLVVTVTSKAEKARALGADEFWLKPIDQGRLIRKLKTITSASRPARLLVIDDDERARYLTHRLLRGTPYALIEAATGPEGVRLAREERPDLILLDFLLNEFTAFDVLDELKADPRTRGVPVIVITSHVLDVADRRRLTAETEAILSKENLSRELAINRIRDALARV